MENVMEKTTSEELNINEFLPLAGADETAEEVKMSIMSNPNLDIDIEPIISGENEEEGKTKNKEAEKIIDELLNINDEDKDASGEQPTKKENKKSSSATETLNVFKTLIDSNVLLPFEDTKPIEEYAPSDWVDLIKANIEDKQAQIKETVAKEIIDSYPEKMKIADRYIKAGGTDLVGLFSALAQTEKIESLDPNNETHQEHIVRQYLYATEFGDEELIEEQINEWTENKLLGKKAQVFKPKLDQINNSIIQDNIQKQEDLKKIQLKKREEYVNNIINVLKPGKVNDINIPADKRDYLYEELTKSKYQSLSGKKTNLLGKLLEDYQFGKEPRYDLIIEATMLLSDPDGYKEALIQKGKNEVTKDTVRKLKTEQERKEKATYSGDDSDNDGNAKRKLHKPRNIFENLS